ncbi:MAG: hypothetical protein HRU41_33940 [Saprospiraceae bacterium]|nr:hypothetical protein [Saprospiraceae bacterium]
MKKILSNVLNQIIPIMIGVYLGFAVNNFGENRKVKQQVRTYQEMLKIELEENLQALEKVRNYHVRLSKDFSNLLASEELEKDFEATNFQGLKPGFVSSSAYQTGLQTGIIQEFDLNLVQILNRCYTLQDKYNTFNENLLSSFQSRKYPETAGEIRNFLINMRMNMNDIKYFEQALQQQYGLILEAL